MNSEKFKKTLFNAEIAWRAAASLRVRQSVEGSRHHRKASGTTDIFLGIADHFEPHVGAPAPALARERLQHWLEEYPKIAARHRDADGRPPAHTFYYPWDEYDDWEFPRLCALCAEGWGELELHLHHRDDTSDSLRAKLQEALKLYRAGGALSVWPDGRAAFGFVHGNWALDNSRHENGRNFCGVNNELAILEEEGCYADFTFPAWQHHCQPRQVNSIYYADDDPLRPKSYDTGRSARAGEAPKPQSGLLMIQGPLAPFWTQGRRGWRIAMDDGDLAASRRYSPARLDRWVRAGIHVLGRPDRVFIKLHCHGAEDRSRAALLGEDLESLFLDAETRYNDGARYRLHYVTAREMFNIVKATEAGAEDSLMAARDWRLPPPAASRNPAPVSHAAVAVLSS